MIRYVKNSCDGPRAVLLFGNGLIGSAIDEALRQQYGWQAKSSGWLWSDRDQRVCAASLLARESPEMVRTDLIWAAGISGFGSSDADMKQETDHVAEIAELAVALGQRSEHVTFHLFSSLGGLFEGQSAIDGASSPHARRPYGRAKLRQEQLVRGLGNSIVPRIYRPSSVYGVAQHGRRGLFAALIAATLQQKPITIYGSANTLRDYVFARDIAAYVVNGVSDDQAAPVTEVLASGKPTSISEAVVTIEQHLGRRLYFRYDSAPHNSLNMTVRFGTPPPTLPRTPLTLGVASVLQSAARRSTL